MFPFIEPIDTFERFYSKIVEYKPRERMQLEKYKTLLESKTAQS